MQQLIAKVGQISTKSSRFSAPYQTPRKPAHSSLRIKQQLGQQIYAALQIAKDLSPEECLKEIKERLLEIQTNCEAIHKVFIVVEEEITCSDYDLGGDRQNLATLFRGPSKDASVAICVTQQGSLLHRNGDSWNIYRNVGDVNPVKTL
jgi:hypothetical protein